MKFSFCLSLALLFSYVGFAQGVLISDTPGQPSSDAMLEVRSTQGGLLLPRLTTAQRNAIANPTRGLQIYNTDTECQETYFPTGWRAVACNCTSAPDPTITPGVSQGNINSPVSFQSVPGAATYAWTFASGTPASSSSANPSVTWTQTGTYQVTLVVTDAQGCSDSSALSFTIINCPSGSQIFNYTGNVQSWTVPACVSSISIDCRGAQGGDNFGLVSQDLGGHGARMQGTFSVQGGQILQIIVGQRGNDATSGNTANGGGGGGGGSFVWVQGQTAQPLIAAGGGGASSLTNNGAPHYYGKDGVTTNTGAGSRSHDQFNDAPGGTNGQDGFGGSAGGKGWLSIVQNPGGKNATSYGGNGGYGGGGGGGANCCNNPSHAAGAGGGYSGGGAGGSIYYYGGGGGGSYNSGTNQTNTAGFQTGHGIVIITW